MKYFLRSTAFKIVVSIILAVISIMIYTFFIPNNIFSNILSLSLYPFQKGFWNLSNESYNFSYRIREKDDMQSEIDYLKSEISELRDKVIDYNELRRENARFAKYYNFKKENNSLKFVPASVIGVDALDFFHGFTIDKGIDSGISKDDIVITENGVVGCVHALNASCAKVRTILSPDIKIGVADIESNESGVISGQLETAKENLTRMIFIPAQNSMKSGDIVATTGLSGMYPKNLKLGKIRSIKYDDRESSYYAIIEPFESLKNIRDVFVITDFQGKGSTTIY